MVLSATARHLQRTVHALQCIVDGDDAAVFPALSLAILTFDIQTCPSEGPNTSSMWLWRKSIQPFRRYLRHKQKKSQTALKTEPYLRVVITYAVSDTQQTTSETKYTNQNYEVICITICFELLDKRYDTMHYIYVRPKADE